VSGPGGRRAALGRPGNRPLRCGEAERKAPSISYMEGALLNSARHEGFCRDDTLANAAVPSGRDVLAAVHPSLRADRRVSPSPFAYPKQGREGDQESRAERRN
jgi:hypothetical protein